jgi:hypothetical protein
MVWVGTCQGRTPRLAAHAQLLCCACKASEDAACWTTMLQRDCGRYADLTFQTFDTERIPPGDAAWERARFDDSEGVWYDQLYAPDEQRVLLREAKATL